MGGGRASGYWGTGCWGGGIEDEMVQWLGTFLKAVKLRCGRGSQVANPGRHQGTSYAAGWNPEPQSLSNVSLMYRWCVLCKHNGLMLLALF